MSSDVQTHRRKHADFWRACRYLAPHRGIVITSIVCAFVVGAAFTSGLGTMLPILNVLIRGDTVQGWMDRQIVQDRLGVQLVDEPRVVQIGKVHDESLAAGAGLHRPDEVVGIAGLDELPSDEKARAGQILSRLGDPVVSEITLRLKPERAVTLRLPAVPWYLRLGRNLAARLPLDPVKSIAAVFAVLASLAIFGNIVRFFQEYLSDKAAILAVNDIRRRLYDHVLHIPLSFFGMKGTSDVTSRLSQDTANLQDGFKTVLGQSIQEPIKAVFGLGLAMWLSWRLTLFIILFAPVMALLIKKFGKKMRRASRKAMQSSATMLGQLEGTLIGIRVVKAANAERFERRRYGGIMDGLIQESLRMSRIDAMSAPILESLTLLVAGAVVLYAAYLVLIAGTLNPQRFILVMIALAGIGESLRRVSKINNALQKANAAAGRIFETMDVPVERPRHLGIELNRPRLRLPSIQNDVRFEDVTFAYPSSPTPALSGVSLVVPKGQSIAIVGRNGSGKTTLLALLPRFYDPQQGRILIDGLDLRSVTLKSLRNQISIVTQDSVIFPGTIASNIAYGIPNADREQVIAAAKRAFAHEFILEKAQGYDTMLGEMGGQLSGGQKQRLCIARAIFRASPILILDEATSQVDAESEHLIQQAISSLMKERTTFVIAHRFSTITSADTIAVMERGQIVGQGSHDQLLRTCEIYQQLYERQLFTTPAVTDESAAAPA